MAICLAESEAPPRTVNCGQSVAVFGGQCAKVLPPVSAASVSNKSSTKLSSTRASKTRLTFDSLLNSVCHLVCVAVSLLKTAAILLSDRQINESLVPLLIVPRKAPSIHYSLLYILADGQQECARIESWPAAWCDMESGSSCSRPGGRVQSRLA